MDRLNLIGQNLLSVLLGLVGSFLFLWFCWPAVFKGIINAGNLCGMLGSAAMVFYGVKHKAVHQLLVNLWQKGPARICLIALLLCMLAGAGLVMAASVAILRASSSDIPSDTPAVVLGCSVMGARPSTILQERIDAAYAYMQEHPQAVCVLSGGQGEGEAISEAECMYRELKRAGIDAGRLYKEAESTNTEENLGNSKKILDGLGLSGEVTVISSEFHLYRGRQWARKLGYQDYGYAAHTDLRYVPAFFLREVIAVAYFWLKQCL